MNTTSTHFKAILSELRTTKELSLRDRNVLLRVDANVPRSPDGKTILDKSRLRGFAPTVQYALNQGARSVILFSHLGKGDVKKDSLQGVADLLPDFLAHGGKTPEIWFRKSYVEKNDQSELRKDIEAFKELHPEKGLVILLENTRFNPGEKAGDQSFAASIAALGDVYINDAFGAAHRADDASVGEVARIFAAQGKAAIGLLMEKEIARVEKIMLQAKEPLVVILGGSKIETKAPILEAIINGPTKDITLALAGETGLALAAVRGLPTAPRNLSADKLALASALDAAIKRKGCEVLLPIDGMIAPVGVKPELITSTEVAKVIPDGFVLFDIGPATIDLYKSKIAAKLASGGTLIANGTMGVYENQLFKAGSVAINSAIAALPDSVDRLIGGGDSGAVAVECGVPDHIISTGGGALLEAIEKGTAAMEALEPLKRR